MRIKSRNNIIFGTTAIRHNLQPHNRITLDLSDAKLELYCFATRQNPNSLYRISRLAKN
jgi:hypothetical protein